MRAFGLWHGGPNYGSPWLDTDLEVFDSIDAARQALRSRDSGWLDATYADGRTDSTRTPGVEDSSIALYFHDPREDRDPYPDLMLTFGPRGGVKVERC